MLPMVTHAFLQEKGLGKLDHESALLNEGLERRKIPVTLFMPKRIARRQLPVTASTLVAGEYPSVLGALKMLNVPEPAPTDYPDCLSGFLSRKVWPSTLGEVLNRLMDGDRGSLFVKPRARSKRFTGCVLEPGLEFSRVAGVSRSEPIWCSEPVEWLSEYRVYVVQSRIVSVDLYSGDASRELDLKVVEEAIRVLDTSGPAFAGYGIDFGVLADGRTALVELNDGFSLGAYAIGADAYTDLILARWEQLLAEGSKIDLKLPGA